MRSPIFRLLPLVLALACSAQETTVSRDAWAPDADADGHTAPTAATAAQNRAAGAALPLDDVGDFEDAERGLLAREKSVVIANAGSGPDVWDTREYAFLEGEAPASVHPSLWRQALT